MSGVQRESAELVYNSGSRTLLWNVASRSISGVVWSVAESEPGTVETITFCRSGTETVNLITDLRGTGTVINYGSGTVIKWNHKSSHRYSTKMWIWFPSFRIFSFTIFSETDKFFPCKKAYYVKRQDFSNNLLNLCFLWSRYGTVTWTGPGTGTVTCQKSEPEPEPNL